MKIDPFTAQAILFRLVGALEGLKKKKQGKKRREKKQKNINMVKSNVWNGMPLRASTRVKEGVWGFKKKL